MYSIRNDCTLSIIWFNPGIFGWLRPAEGSLTTENFVIGFEYAQKLLKK
jgi:hypothetical protein